MVAISGDIKYQHLAFNVLHNVVHRIKSFFALFSLLVCIVIYFCCIRKYVKCNYRRCNAPLKLVRFDFFYVAFVVVCGQTIGTSISLENEARENGTIILCCFYFVEKWIVLHIFKVLNTFIHALASIFYSLLFKLKHN